MFPAESRLAQTISKISFSSPPRHNRGLHIANSSLLSLCVSCVQELGKVRTDCARIRFISYPRENGRRFPKLRKKFHRTLLLIPCPELPAKTFSTDPQRSSQQQAL
jgi:hypothetical protein